MWAFIKQINIGGNILNQFITTKLAVENIHDNHIEKKTSLFV
jgi:hypothetical protein